MRNRLNNDALKNEAVYDAERWQRRLWSLERSGALTRRQALQRLGLSALGGAALAAGLSAPRRALAQATVPAVVKPTPEESFRILNTNRETLWSALAGQGYLTPASLFFIRNHTSTPTIDAATWSLRIEGSGVQNPLDLSYEDLLCMRSVTRTRAIECAGNGRTFFDTQQGTPAGGTQWQLGAIGVAEWRGVRLSDILERAGVTADAIDVLPEGLDPEVGMDGHVRRPLSIEKALDDVLVVYEMNGEPLPPDHGYPARLLVPGWIGIANIKWLGRIEVSTEPLFSAWNTRQYTFTGEAYPDAPVLTTQVLKSAFELALPATLAAGDQLLTGRSWSAVGTIQSVDVSFDGGQSWLPAELNGRNVRQAWAQWSIPWQATPGNHVLAARATDSAGNTQPLTTTFNDGGYLFGAVVNHPVTVT
jgi:DMSO/TMAO reductase YedYZ molybdopterin-dependent catalytic subunit